MHYIQCNQAQMWKADVREIMNNEVIQCQLSFYLIITGSLNYRWEKCICKALNIFQLLNSTSIYHQKWVTYKEAESECYIVLKIIYS